ncbi:MAG: hybrid sensor histidine kinase/response regulator [Pseudolabrys sp.]|nr:hybrid sensor histidine kinase/response regulator [Pseudolabrys sp.]
MDDLLREFVTETNESLDVVDVELVRFEQDPNNAKILDNIFRLVHTIKGTCGFLELPRLETLAHAAETVMGKFRDGLPATHEAVTVILATIDRIKKILESLERDQREPDGADTDLINDLERVAARIETAKASPAIERPLKPGEASPEELERAFRETPVDRPAVKPAARPAARPAATDEPAKDDDAKGGHQSIRVPVDSLEQLMTMVSELVLTRNQLLEIVRRHDDSEFKTPLQRLSNVTAELQEGVMKTRMQPIGNAWQKFPRIVRDLANELGKQIELELQGAETELDRQVLDLIKDPLTHMVRNSADHGLETPEQRRAAGKPVQGYIRLSAYHEGGHIIIQVADDGCGLNTDRIKAKAVAQGLVSEGEVEKLSESQIHKFIFAPGFSTAAAITSVSGRGVGMDVVRNNIDQIGGTIDVKSVAGVGLSFTIKIPLTLAIVAALIVEAAGERFAIPQLSVVELVRARKGGDHRIERIKNTTVLRLRDKLLPLARLSSLLGTDSDPAANVESGFIVVTQVGSQTFGIVVDSVFHTEEIVVKPMSSKLRHISMFSGNTILGDGAVIMIIDPNGVARAPGPTMTPQMATAESAQARPVSADEQMTSLLVFRAGSTQPKAVPLSLITRLEEIDARKIELSNGRHMVQYRGQLMPLITMDPTVSVKGEGAQPLLVFSDGARSMALVVDEIIDIVEDHLAIQVASGTPGVLGSAVIKGHATEIIDVGHFLPLAYEDWFRRKDQTSAARAHSVLLVDDSPFFRNMLVPVLQAAGYSVTAVGSAREALAMLQDGRVFDVAVTDIEMPEMDGFAFAEHLRADPHTADLPVIALSSQVSADSVERGRHAGFHDFVAKFDRQGLIAALMEQTEAGRAA